MAVGDRIKRVRQFRGLTQKELGKLVGFDEKTADIRIAQYESNRNDIDREGYQVYTNITTAVKAL